MYLYFILWKFQKQIEHDLGTLFFWKLTHPTYWSLGAAAYYAYEGISPESGFKGDSYSMGAMALNILSFLSLFLMVIEQKYGS